LFALEIDDITLLGRRQFVIDLGRGLDDTPVGIDLGSKLRDHSTGGHPSIETATPTRRRECLIRLQPLSPLAEPCLLIEVAGNDRDPDEVDETALEIGATIQVPVGTIQRRNRKHIASALTPAATTADGIKAVAAS